MFLLELDNTPPGGPTGPAGGLSERVAHDIVEQAELFLSETNITTELCAAEGSRVRWRAGAGAGR